jgi:hypothetical protein
MKTEQALELLDMIKSYEIHENNSPEFIEGNQISIGLYHYSDMKGNIIFEIDTIEDMMNDLLIALKKYNEKYEKDFDITE